MNNSQLCKEKYTLIAQEIQCLDVTSPTIIFIYLSNYERRLPDIAEMILIYLISLQGWKVTTDDNGTTGLQNAMINWQDNLTGGGMNDSSISSFYAMIRFYLDGILLTMIAILGMFGKSLLNIILVPIKCNNINIKFISRF